MEGGEDLSYIMVNVDYDMVFILVVMYVCVGSDYLNYLNLVSWFNMYIDFNIWIDYNLMYF